MSGATRTVTVDFINFNGTIITTQVKTLGAGQSGGLVTFVDSSTPLVYCRFTLTGGAKADIRGSIQLQTSGGPIQAALPAE